MRGQLAAAIPGQRAAQLHRQPADLDGERLRHGLGAAVGDLDHQQEARVALDQGGDVGVVRAPATPPRS